MRDIKFRFWNKEDKAWEDVEYVSPKDFMPFWYDNDSGIPEPYSWTELIPMQYTGLKDKNGVEIYEGDIIDTHFSESFPPRYREVVFENGAFQINPNPDGLERMLQEPQLFEVIGNIYDNPELISEKH